MSLERGRSSSGCRNPGDVGKGRNSRKSDEGEGLCVKCIPKDWGEITMVNLKKLNKHVHTEHFNTEGIHLLKDLLRKGDWMTKVGLKVAYFMVLIHRGQILLL